ncbi:Tyrosine-protein kinase, partial [Parasponia andersonii]
HSGAGENHFPKLNNSQTNLAIPNPILSPTTPAKVNPKNFYKAVGLASSATLAILLITGLTILLRRRRRTHQLDDEEKPSPRAVVLEEKVRQLCRRFTLDEIRTATNNFDPDLKIGDGGFGRVYKGHIDSDKENLVAVKVLKSTSSQGVREFWTEIEALSKLRHPHLASLIECLKLYGKIADRCLRSDRNRRPKMADVLKALEFALRLQNGSAAAAEEGIGISESGKSDEKMSCWGGGNQVVLRPPCKDHAVHSCPGKSKSQKMLLRFFSDKAGFKWATQPRSRASMFIGFEFTKGPQWGMFRKQKPENI